MPGGVVGVTHLEGHEPAVLAHHPVGGLVAGEVAEMDQSRVAAAAVEHQFPEVDVGRAAGVLFVAFEEGVLPVGEGALERWIKGLVLHFTFYVGSITRAKCTARPHFAPEKSESAAARCPCCPSHGCGTLRPSVSSW